MQVRVQNTPRSGLGDLVRVGEAVNIAWMTYQNTATRRFGFSDNNYDRRLVLNAIPSNLNTVRPTQEQSTNTATALNALRTALYINSQGARRGNADEVIIIVRGEEIRQELSSSSRQNQIRNAIDQLRRNRINTIVIADGDVGKPLLRQLVTSTTDQDDNIFVARTFQDIVNEVADVTELDLIANAVCPRDTFGNYNFIVPSSGRIFSTFFIHTWLHLYFLPKFHFPSFLHVLW